MSNYLKSEKTANITREVLVSFIMSKGYIGKMKMIGSPSEYPIDNSPGEITLYKKSNKKNEKVSIPYTKYFTLEQAKIILSKTDLSISDFEEYLKSDL